MELPASPADDLADVPRVAVRDKVNSPRWGTPADEQRRLLAAYYACVSFVDAQVGVLLDALDRLGIADETVVVLTADHGFHRGEHGGIWGKGTLFEESLRVPLLVARPGAGPARTSRLVETVDVFPTLAELCGLPAESELEGTSLAPLLDAPDRAWKSAVFAAVRKGRVLAKSVRTERYRYTDWGKGRGRELYDLAEDPGQFTNLAAKPRHAATVASMRRLLRSGWRAAVPDE
jgi:uncharacterized sulfatase